MKQGTNFTMDVNINYDLASIESVDIIFVQDDARKLFHYPSDVAWQKDEENVIQLKWTYEDTFLFDASKFVKMDTHISLSDSQENPETSIVMFKIAPTLFTKEEIDSTYGTLA